MKIAFWSNVHGQVATTSNMLAVAIYSCIKNNRKIALLESHYKFNNLEAPLLGTIEQREFYMDTGIDALLRDSKSGMLTESVILDDAISLLDKQCSLYLGTTKTDRKVYETDMIENISQILTQIDECHEFTFIDVASGYNPLSTYILQQADLIVVNLCQNEYVLTDIFREWVYKNKSIYLIGRYDENSSLNKKNVCHRFKILKNEIGTIEYNVEFMDSVNRGEVIDFILKNVDISWYNNNFSFIQSLDAVVTMIEQKGGVYNYI